MPQTNLLRQMQSPQPINWKYYKLLKALEHPTLLRSLMKAFLGLRGIAAEQLGEVPVPMDRMVPQATVQQDTAQKGLQDMAQLAITAMSKLLCRAINAQVVFVQLVNNPAIRVSTGMKRIRPIGIDRSKIIMDNHPTLERHRQCRLAQDRISLNKVAICQPVPIKLPIRPKQAVFLRHPNRLCVHSSASRKWD